MSSEKSFEDLVEQAFTVGGQAFDDLNKLIYCFLRFMGNHSDAEDVTQETLLIIWQRWEADVRDRSSLKPGHFKLPITRPLIICGEDEWLSPYMR